MSGILGLRASKTDAAKLKDPPPPKKTRVLHLLTCRSAPLTQEHPQTHHNLNSGGSARSPKT